MERGANCAAIQASHITWQAMDEKKRYSFQSKPRWCSRSLAKLEYPAAEMARHGHRSKRVQYCIGRRFHLKIASSALNHTKVFAESWPEGETRKNRKTLLTVRKSQNQARGVSPQAIKKKSKERKETKTRLTLSRNSSRRRRDWIRSRLLWSYNHRPSGQ